MTLKHRLVVVSVVNAFVFAWVVGKETKTVNLSPIANEAIAWGDDIQGLGYPWYTCDFNHIAFFYAFVHVILIFALKCLDFQTYFTKI